MDKKTFLAGIILLIICVFSVWSIVVGGQVVPNFGSDGYLINWIMHQPIWTFQGSIFYPYHNVLAYADMLKISSLLWGGNYSLALIAGQILTGLVLFAFYKKFGSGSALVAAVAVVLSQIRFEYQVHLQMWNMQYWLGASGLIILGLKQSSRRILTMGWLLLAAQFYESPLPILFALVVLGVWILGHKKYFSYQKFIFPGLLFLVLILPGLTAYLGVSWEFNFIRDIREAAHNSISVNDLWGHYGSFSLWVLAAVVVAHKKINKTYLMITIIGLVMALGPVLKWQGETVKIWGKYFIPLPYGIVYYLLPGMAGFRVPARWLALAIFGLGGVIAEGLANINLKKALLLCGLVVALGARIDNVTAYPVVPKVYWWLKNQPGKVVLEVPVYTWPRESWENERMYFNLFSGKTSVNGYSGFTPPLVYSLSANPHAKLPRGIDYIISHDQKLRYNLPIIYEDEKDTVYLNR